MKWRIDDDGYVYNSDGHIIGVTRKERLPPGEPIAIYELPKNGRPTPDFVQDTNAQKMPDTSDMSLNEKVSFYERESKFYATMLMPKASINFLGLAMLARTERIYKKYC